MKYLTNLILYILIVHVSYSQDYKISSDKTKEISYAVSRLDQNNATWGNIAPKRRITIINSGESIDFNIETETNIGNRKVIWKIENQDKSFFEIGYDNPPELVFTKNTTNAEARYDKYNVELYIEDVLEDQIPIYVTYKLDIPYKNSFNTPYDNVDVLNRQKVAGYPEFSGDYINLSGSDQVGYSELINKKSLYTTYYGIHSRTNNSPGSMIMTSPSINDIETCDPLSICELNNRSRVKRNDVNFYPHLSSNKDYYYAISIKIPNDDSFSSDFLNNYFNILFEFHQDEHMDNQLSTGGSAPLHLIYTKNANQDEVMRINYGIDEIENSIKRPINRLSSAVDILYNKGEWIDFIFHVKWKQMYNKLKVDNTWNWNSDGTDGLFECWYKKGTNDYTKVMFNDPSAESPSPFTYSQDKKTLYGPNLENAVPTYITLNQYRLKNSNTVSVNLPETTVYFDDLRIANTFDEVKQTTNSTKKFNDDKRKSNIKEGVESKIFSTLKDIRVFPNPNQGVLFIKLGNIFKSVDLEISNLLGEVKWKGKYENTNFIKVDLKDHLGFYFIKLKTNIGQRTFKIIKE